tara:strand:+ start:1049 stop:2062 length:1014 start_codon:yes stop_codon:yes gene_type:complete
MGFLDNSGDIILDAVLTDTGRMRMAKGDNSFKIVKYAFGDDEINYEVYNKNHQSGSAYFDLEILQTPILEAITNNTSLLKHKLMSIPRTNLLYLPVITPYEKASESKRNESTTQANNKWVVAVDSNTRHACAAATNPGIIKDGDPVGVINGLDSEPQGACIRLDQGLNTTEISPTFSLSRDLLETQYIVEIDNRLGSIVSAGSRADLTPAGGANQSAAVSFIDDDNIASYFFSMNTDPQFVVDITTKTGLLDSPVQGPRGSSLIFKIRSSIELQTSTFLFERLGKTNSRDGTTWARPAAAPNSAATVAVNYIDSIVRVTGATTGYRIDIPIRFVKLA